MFDWFNPLTAPPLSSRFPPPPSPVVFKETLDGFWPVTVPAQWSNCQQYLRIYDIVRATAVPNYIEARIPLPSGLNIPVWRKLLAGFPDSSLVDHLEFGWPLDYTSHNIPVPTLANHSPSAISDVHILSFIEKERSFKALLGPFPAQPFAPWFQVSPMMTRPKKNSPNKRVIIDLSFPPGRSVNSGI